MIASQRGRGWTLLAILAWSGFGSGPSAGSESPAVAPAPSGEDRHVQAGRAWWAFQPIARVAVPELPPELAQGARNPIDAFVRDAQAQLGMIPALEADKVTLIRRVTLDLTGLPPRPEEVDAFLADDRPDAYEHLVDRLLGSPAFGERWGRYWLDLARYADSGGFEFDTRRPNAWRYRDWVVDALNADMPFDQFIRLQLAADEFQPGDPTHLPALGFLRNGPTVGNQMNEKIRMDELDDIVGTTTSVFLGLTVACARCHDHKFDPVPTEDYYRLVAVFAPGTFADLELATAEQKARHREATQAVEQRADQMRQQIMAIEREARDRLDARKLAELPDAWRKALETGNLTALTSDEQKALEERIKIEPEEVEAELTALEHAVLAEWRARIALVEAEAPKPLPMAPGVVESPRRVQPVHLLVRGEVQNKGPVVTPGPLRAVAGAVLDFPEPPDGARSTGRRAALADWIADPDNPLTARVQVNRIWQGHFGQGLVTTPSDFGVMGDEPMLPELLDWLASEFLAQGWSQKAIHRLIVTSATYRQASRIRPEMHAIDPENVLFWRFPVRRLEAEAIRDAILWCAGTLNPARSGPGVFPPIDPGIVATGNVPRWPLDAKDGPEVWKRSLYLFQMRSVPLPLLEVFDLPDSTQSCPQRARTTIPTQSLSLLNNPFLIDQARRFAERVAREAGDDPDHRIDRAHRLATGRTPSPTQHQAMTDFLTQQSAWHAEQTLSVGGEIAPDLAALADLCHVLLNSNIFLYLD